MQGRANQGKLTVAVHACATLPFEPLLAEQSCNLPLFGLARQEASDITAPVLFNDCLAGTICFVVCTLRTSHYCRLVSSNLCPFPPLTASCLAISFCKADFSVVWVACLGGFWGWLSRCIGIGVVVRSPCLLFLVMGRTLAPELWVRVTWIGVSRPESPTSCVYIPLLSCTRNDIVTVTIACCQCKY